MMITEIFYDGDDHNYYESHDRNTHNHRHNHDIHQSKLHAYNNYD